MTWLEMASRGKNAWWRYVLTLVLAMVLMMALTAAVFLPLGLLRMLPSNFGVQVQNPAAHPILFFAANGVAFAALLASVIAAARIVQQKRFADIAGQWRWTSVGLGFGLWAVAMTLDALLDFGLSRSGFALTAGDGTLPLILVAAPVLAVQTFTEEFVFRGLVTQGLLLATRRPVVAAVLSGLVFGLLHIPNGPWQAAGALVFGVATALIAFHTRSLAFGFGLHFANNLFGAVILVSGDDVFKGSPGLFSQSTPALSGLDFGVSALALVAVTWLVMMRRIAEPVGSLS